MKRRLFFEFLIIFISVMLAFLTEDWRENRQDRKEYAAVLKEIESNIRRDSIEIGNDLRYIESQISEIVSLIDSSKYFDLGRVHKMIFEVTNVRWPDFESTGYEQLRNHVSYPADYTLISQINEYYAWLIWLNDRHEFMDIRPAQKLHDFYLKKGVPPAYFRLTAEDSIHLRDLLSEKELYILLKNLVVSKANQAGVYRVGQQTGEAILRRFRNDPANANLPVSKISLIGTGVGESWSSEIQLNHIGGGQWEIRTHLNSGLVKFRSNSNWATNWGDEDFPQGIGIQDGLDIPVVEGEYLIKFNHESGAYMFELISQ